MGTYVGIAATAAGTYDGTVNVAYAEGGVRGGAYAVGVYTGVGAGTNTVAGVAGPAFRCPDSTVTSFCCVAIGVLQRSPVSTVMVLAFLFSTCT